MILERVEEPRVVLEWVLSGGGSILPVGYHRHSYLGDNRNKARPELSVVKKEESSWSAERKGYLRILCITCLCLSRSQRGLV